MTAHEFFAGITAQEARDEDRGLSGHGKARVFQHDPKEKDGIAELLVPFCKTFDKLLHVGPWSLVFRDLSLKPHAG